MKGVKRQVSSVKHQASGIRVFFLATFIFLSPISYPLSPVFAQPTTQEEEVAPPPPAAPSAEELRQTIRHYIANMEQKMGSFAIPDPKDKGILRTLTLIRVHERVGKTGDYYYSCTDMKDVATGDELDLDFDISDTGQVLQVVAVRIHKDNGKPRYTYDANDNLIPLS